MKQSYLTGHKHNFLIGGVALLLSAIGIGWGWDKKPSLGQQYDDYYHPYEVVILRGGGHLSETAQPAAVLYSQEKYDVALPLLLTLQQNQDNPDYWALLTGNAYLQVDSTQEAREQFRKVEAPDNSVYQQYARWYIALSYLKDQQEKEAFFALQAIAQQPGLFQKEARQLLSNF